MPLHTEKRERGGTCLSAMLSVQRLDSFSSVIEVFFIYLSLEKVRRIPLLF